MLHVACQLLEVLASQDCNVSSTFPRHDGIFVFADALRVVAQRHAPKGQQAMALAMIYPEDGGKGGRGKKDAARNLREKRGFSQDRLDCARAVLRHSRSLAEADERVGAERHATEAG